ncbi:MGH1-like glycoside hydrolase domain-containing protein [Caballeronia sp. LZ034LL]|uniref:MGH1-like glycoside hydrolase domain-containing protein n=1 Tax=Caballeronia sp. LZ034LL TaxID=3038567 RepID=UPI00285CB407|nr:hypothetical protein [Caballeronia sp. LZ034LL]MDR5839178.1 hypothetical protein [Caballeronia sp. LZ034LL]
MKYAGRSTGSLVVAGVICCVLVGPTLKPLDSLAAQSVPSSPVSANDAPQLKFSLAASQQTLGATYNGAIADLLTTNQVTAQGSQLVSGKLTGSPPMIIQAGTGYADEVWTRDASINSWNAANLIAPQLAANTLWAVVTPTTAQVSSYDQPSSCAQPATSFPAIASLTDVLSSGTDSSIAGSSTATPANAKLIVQQDGEWWDQVVWITAAWDHYLMTGDKDFLKAAYPVARRTLAVRKAFNYCSTLNLFQGPSLINDGIAGYPAPPANASDVGSSFVLDYAGASNMLSLSTNGLYYAAYRNLANMARELGRPEKEVSDNETMAGGIKDAINKNFWAPDQKAYEYLIVDPANPVPAQYQEADGTALAVLFGIADDQRARHIIKHAPMMTWGAPDVYPAFPRYSAQQPGRHDNIVWGVMQGFWAEAQARVGDTNGLASSLNNQALLYQNNNSNFYETYNGDTGIENGGWQNNTLYQSQPNQTFSATAYLRMIYRGVFGIEPRVDGLKFEPVLPKSVGDVEISNLRYRNAVLDIKLRGAGDHVKKFKLDGVATSNLVPKDLSGNHTIEISLDDRS